MAKAKLSSYARMHQRFSQALVAMETSKPEAHVWRLFEVFKPLPRPAGAALALWAAERAVTAMEEETPNDHRGEQAVEAMRGWLWGRTELREIYKRVGDLSAMQHRYARRVATQQACEAVHFAASVTFAEMYWTLISSAFVRSANANVAIRAGSLKASRAHAIREEEHALQREVTRGFLNALVEDESALILLDECSDGDEQARAIWMDRITDLGLTI